ncbi:MAG: hypothetical protein K8S54_15165 [Spirochaetia bacterium]|nr:hypothetical protein [Spirochaetia bacterium]
MSDSKINPGDSLPSATSAPRAIVPEVISPGSVSAIEEETERVAPATGMKRILWILVAIFCAFWIVFPEPTDVIPILGWLDEGLAAGILLTALARIGIHIPFVSKWVESYVAKRSMGIIGGKKKKK